MAKRKKGAAPKKPDSTGKGAVLRQWRAAHAISPRQQRKLLKNQRRAQREHRSVALGVAADAAMAMLREANPALTLPPEPRT